MMAARGVAAETREEVEALAGEEATAADRAERITLQISIPHNEAGALIGKGGAMLQEISTRTGAKLRIQKQAHMDW